MVQADGTTRNKSLQREDELEAISAAAWQAYGYATGALTVPSVSSSGLTIDGSNVILGSVGKLKIIGNGSIFLGSSANNSAMVLNQSGISIGTGASIGIAAGGSINIDSGGAFTVKSNGAFTINSGGSFTVNSGGAVSITASGTSGSLFVDIQTKDTSNVVVSRFYLNSTRLTADNASACFTMYAGASFSAASSGMSFSTQNGLKIKGEITATTGSIGGFQIKSNAIYKTKTAINDTDNAGVYIGTGGIALGTDQFKVTSSGALTATNATITGKITATSGSIAGFTITTNTSNSQSYLTTGTGLSKVSLGAENSDWKLFIGANNPENLNRTKNSGGYWVYGGTRTNDWAPFKVNAQGDLYAENLCLGNGPSNASKNDYIYNNGWDDYVGKLWLFVKDTWTDGTPYFQWRCVSSTQLWFMLQDIEKLWAAVNMIGTPASKDTTAKKSSGCFIAGTKIQLYNGTFINIEQLQLGMKIRAYDEATRTFATAKVVALQLLEHKSDIYDIVLSSGKIITMTASHPLLTTEGWKSLNKEKTKLDHEIDVDILHENDELITEQGRLFIKSINYREDLIDTDVYHCHIEPYNTFIVDGVVAHNTSVFLKNK